MPSVKPCALVGVGGLQASIPMFLPASWTATVALWGAFVAQLGPEADRLVERSGPAPKTLVAPTYRAMADFAPPTHVFAVFDHEWPGLMTGLATHITPSAELVFLQEDGKAIEPGYRFRDALPTRVRRRVQVLPIWVDSMWIRDFGPRVLIGAGEVHWLDPIYDVDRTLDDAAPRKLAQAFDVQVTEFGYDLDGGALSSNGEGLCLMTESSWASISPETAGWRMRRVSRQFGCDELVLLPPLLYESTGHVDVFAQFVSADHIMLGRVDPEESAIDARRLEEARGRIEAWAERKGKEIRITRIDMPVLAEGDYYSYINGLQLEDRYIAPRFRQIPEERERPIMAQLAEAMQGRKIVELPASVLQELDGVIHCATLGVRLPTRKAIDHARIDDAG